MKTLYLLKDYIIKYKTIVIVTVFILLLISCIFIRRINTNEKFTNVLNPDVIILTTRLGKNYGNRIADEMVKMRRGLNIRVMNIDQLTTKCDKLIKNTKLIIARAATPTDNDWMRCLKRIEKNGTIVMNPTKILQLTSNKLVSSIYFLREGLPHPDSKDGTKSEPLQTLSNVRNMLDKHKKIIIKPYTSRSQGQFVQIINNTMTDNEILGKIDTIPTDKFVIQEFVSYKAIYRVIVVNNKALPMAYKDVPTKNKWKVSVCLNPKMSFIPNPPKKLLRTAERVQKTLLNGGVHFIDLFELDNGKYVISEINTACSLILHEKKAKMANHPYHNIAKHLAKYYLTLL